MGKSRVPPLTVPELRVTAQALGTLRRTMENRPPRGEVGVQWRFNRAAVIAALDKVLRRLDELGEEV